MSESSPPAPPGWTSHYDPDSKKTYYVNDTTAETSWELPVVAAGVQREASFAPTPVAPTPVVPPAKPSAIETVSPMGGGGGVVADQPVPLAAGGGDELNVPSFGPVLYQIDQEDKKANTHFVLRFHKNFIVIYESEKFCCYPHGYTKRVLPRCSVIGAEINKASVNKTKIMLGWFAAIVGLVLAIIYKPDNSGGSGSGYDDAGAGYTDDGGSTPLKTILLIVGILLILAGVFNIIYPLFFRTYMVTLKLMRESPAPTACFGIVTLPAPTILLRIHNQPDDNFIIDYVYGKLAGNMDGAHIAAHGISNHIFSTVKPKATLDDLV